MNQLYRLTVFGPTAALLMMVTAFGQTTTPQTGSASPAPEDIEREKTALYEQFLEYHRNDPARAYKQACDYLQRFSSDDSGQTHYVKTFVNLFAREAQNKHVKRLVEEANYAEAFRFGKEMLKADPNDFGTLFTLVQGGVSAFANGNKSYGLDTAEYAKRAIVLLEKDPRYIDKEPTLGRLYISLGVLYHAADEETARVYFTKFSELRTVRNDPRMYARVADAIIGAEYTPLKDEFHSRYQTSEERMSTEAQPLRLRLYRTVDFIIDALARAIALAGSDPRFAHLTRDWMKDLVSFYKYRNSGYITGLPELIQGILNEPFPRAPEHYF